MIPKVYAAKLSLLKAHRKDVASACDRKVPFGQNWRLSFDSPFNAEPLFNATVKPIESVYENIIDVWVTMN